MEVAMQDDVRMSSRIRKTYKRGRRSGTRSSPAQSTRRDSSFDRQNPNRAVINTRKRARSQSRDGRNRLPQEIFEDTNVEATPRPIKRSRKSHWPANILTPSSRDHNLPKPATGQLTTSYRIEMDMSPPNVNLASDTELSPVSPIPAPATCIVPSSGHQKENKLGATSGLASPFRDTNRSDTHVRPGHAKSSPFSSFVRHSSAGHGLRDKPSLSLLRRPSGSHALNKSQDMSSQLFTPIPSSRRSLLPRMSLQEDSFQFDLPSGNGPLAMSTPLTKTQRRDRILEQLNSILESPFFSSEKAVNSRAHRRIKLPEDSIFSTSLELSVSPTTKQTAKVSIAISGLPRKASDSASEGAVSGTGVDSMAVDDESEDVLDMLAHMAIDDDACRVTFVNSADYKSRAQVSTLQTRPSHRKYSKKAPRISFAGSAYPLLCGNAVTIDDNLILDDGKDDALLLTSKGWDWVPPP